MKHLKLFEDFDWDDEDEEEESEGFQGFELDDVVVFTQPYRIKVRRKHPFSNVGVITNFYIKKGQALVEIRADGGTMIEIEEEYLTDLFKKGDDIQLKHTKLEHPTLNIKYGTTYQVINKATFENDRIGIIDDNGTAIILPSKFFYKVRK